MAFSPVNLSAEQPVLSFWVARSWIWLSGVDSGPEWDILYKEEEWSIEVQLLHPPPSLLVEILRTCLALSTRCHQTDAIITTDTNVHYFTWYIYIFEIKSDTQFLFVRSKWFSSRRGLNVQKMFISHLSINIATIVGLPSFGEWPAICVLVHPPRSCIANYCSHLLGSHNGYPCCRTKTTHPVPSLGRLI